MVVNVDFEEIQAQAGAAGRWQWMIFFVGSLSGFFNAFHHVGYVFLGAETDHWCYIPEASNLTTTKGLWVSNDVFNNNSDRAGIVAGDENNNMSDWTWERFKTVAFPMETRNDKKEFSQCRMYDLNYSVLLKQPWRENFSSADSNPPKTIPCDSWQYDRSEYESTIVTEWDLVCGRKPLLSTVQATYMAGVFIGCLLYGTISDRFGRRKAILVAMVLFIISGLAAAFSVHYVMFIVLRMILAMSAAGLFTCTFVLATEITDPEHRCMFGIFFQIPFALGYMALPGIAYIIRDWKYLQLAIAVPNILLIIYVWVLPESPRWLVTNGRFDDALVVLKQAAKMNKKKLPPDDEMVLMMKVYRENETSSSDNEKQRTGLSVVLEIIQRPHILRRILIIYFTWFVVAMVYYGLVLNVGNLGSNKYLISFLMAAVEIPAYFLVYLLIKKGGRRAGYCGTFLSGGAACLLILAIPKDVNWLVASLAVVGKFCITATFAISYLFTAELFPTSVRNVAVNSSSMCGRIGSISAPYIVHMLAAYHRVIPLVLFGTLSVLAGVFALFLPETNKLNLKENWKSADEEVRSDGNGQCLPMNEPQRSSDSSEETEKSAL